MRDGTCVLLSVRVGDSAVIEEGVKETVGETEGEGACEMEGERLALIVTDSVTLAVTVGGLGVGERVSVGVGDAVHSLDCERVTLPLRAVRDKERVLAGPGLQEDECVRVGPVPVQVLVCWTVKVTVCEGVRDEDKLGLGGC